MLLDHSNESLLDWSCENLNDVYHFLRFPIGEQYIHWLLEKNP